MDITGSITHNMANTFILLVYFYHISCLIVFILFLVVEVVGQNRQNY